MSNKALKLKPISFCQNISLGCDPEFFFADQRGDVVGSEKILTNQRAAGVIIDGVQAELNPGSSSCRESLASSISECFIRLRGVLQMRGNDVTVKMDTLVNISERELNSLSDASRRFGCAPSTNIYNTGDDKTSEIKADAATYLKRSAGGHIHLGNYFSGYLTGQVADDYPDKSDAAKRVEKALKHMPEIMVPVLDIVVGNTCVLLDRQAGNKERRQNYGRVGEFRLKPYGIEYRTLSNFWLRSYQLMSLVTGLCRFAVHLVSESSPDNDFVKALFDAVSRNDIVKAVNENDYELALANFKEIEPIILAATGDYSNGYWPLGSSVNIRNFYHFVDRIQEKGLESWFPEDPMTHWCGQYSSRGGWERFSSNVIGPSYFAWETKQKKAVIDLNAQPAPVSAVTV